LRVLIPNLSQSFEIKLLQAFFNSANAIPTASDNQFSQKNLDKNKQITGNINDPGDSCGTWDSGGFE
jgi:hypothetical protein